MEIITLLACLSPVTDYTIIRQLSIVAEAILAMSGRITMLGISRWTDKEDYGSYRTIQRLFYTKINWVKLRGSGVREHIINKEDKDNVILIAADEVVVTKSGKETYGLGRYFSSLSGKAIPSICFLCMSLINVGQRRSYPVVMEQVVKEELPDEKKPVKTTQKGKKGRPKGSGNKNRKDVELSPYLQFVKATLKGLLNIVGTDLSLVYFVFDGAFGKY